eukprot:1190175-Prorocentrum_minimum.AAC.1
MILHAQPRRPLEGGAASRSSRLVGRHQRCGRCKVVVTAAAALEDASRRASWLKFSQTYCPCWNIAYTLTCVYSGVLCAPLSLTVPEDNHRRRKQIKIVTNLQSFAAGGSVRLLLKGLYVDMCTANGFTHLSISGVCSCVAGVLDVPPAGAALRGRLGKRAAVCAGAASPPPPPQRPGGRRRVTAILICVQF